MALPLTRRCAAPIPTFTQLAMSRLKIIPSYSAPGPGRALGQRQGSRYTCRGQPARRRRAVRVAAVLLLRPVRPRAASIADSRTPQRTGSWYAETWRRGSTSAFWLRDGAVAAAMNVNQWDDGDALQELVDTGRPITDKELVSL